jgi:hypothetical protein
MWPILTGWFANSEFNSTDAASMTPVRPIGETKPVPIGSLWTASVIVWRFAGMPAMCTRETVSSVQNDGISIPSAGHGGH